MLSILLARLAEVEAPVVAGEGAHAGDHHLPERGVDVEEEGPVEIPAGELAEVGLVPADVVSVVDPV